MRRLRTTLVALLTLALAALPVAGASASVASLPTPAEAAMPADCAEHAQPAQASHDQAQGHHAEADPAKADNKADKGHCGDHPSCSGKCLCLGLGLTAVLPGSSQAPAAVPLQEKAQPAASSAQSQAYIPPPPPPRV